MARYTKDSTLQVAANFKDILGVDTDPTTIKLETKYPDGTISTLTYGVDAAVVRDNVGDYHCYLALTQEGLYWYRWRGLGTITGSREGTFEVPYSRF